MTRQTTASSYSKTGGRSIPPLVSTQWLADNLDLPNLVVIDIRSNEEYSKGHIPNAVNVPFELPDSGWCVTKEGLMLELPPKERLFQTIGSVGIKHDSVIVVVGKIGEQPYPLGTFPFPLADAVRVANTLLYAGLKNVAVLDGAYEKWAEEGKPVSCEAVRPKPVPYESATHDEWITSKEYILDKINSKDGETIIVDTRDPDVYFGLTLEWWAPVPGHIPGAKNLPVPWLWKENRTWRDLETIREMVSGVIGTDKSKEIIVYCGVGGYTFTLGYVLREMLGYTDVKLFDGGFEGWTQLKPSGPVVAYKWE